MADQTDSLEKAFTNRRGRTHNADGVVIDGDKVNLEYVDTSLENEDETPLVAPKAPRVRKEIHAGKLIKWILVAVTLLLLLPFGIGEATAWRYNDSRTKLLLTVKDTINGTVLPMQRKDTISADQIHAVYVKLENARNDACGSGLMDNIAKLYPRAKTAFDTCSSYSSKLAAVTVQLKSFEQEARYVEQISKAFSAISAPTTETFFAIPTHKQNWTNLQADIKSVSTPDALQNEDKALRDAINQTTGDWIALNNAFFDKSASQFDLKKAALKDDYVGVTDAVKKIDDKLMTTQAALSAAAASLTNSK